MLRTILRTQCNIFCCLLLAVSVTAFGKTNVNIKYKVSGIGEPALTNVQDRLKVSQKNLANLSKEQMREKIQQQVPEEVKRALEPFGYFHPEVVAHYHHLSADKWNISIHIKPGPAVRVSDVTIEITGPGANLPELQQYIKQFPIKKGDVLNTADYDDAKKNLFAMAYNAGYIGANYKKSRIFVDRKNQTAKVVLHLDTGLQYYFGTVRFQQTMFDPDFLQRYVRFKPGEPYTTEKLMQLNKALNSTDYFSNVSVHPLEKQTHNQQVPIDVNLTPSKGQKYTFGAGFGTDTGPRGQVGIHWRHLTSTGQNFQAFLQASRIESSLNAHYYIPGKNPITDRTFIGATYSTESPNTSHGETGAFSVGHQFVFHHWKTSLSMAFQHDHYSLRDLPYRTTNLGLPRLTLLRTHVDDIIFPRHGFLTDFELRGSSRAFGSTSFIQGISSGKWIISPNENSRLLMRTKLGMTGVDNLERVPLSLQLFAGGSQSIRGYDYKQLGPGKYLYVASTEYQHKLYKNIWGTAFVDAGNAVNNIRHPERGLIGKPGKLANVHPTDIAKVGAGLGLMYVSPIGPLELTFADPLTDRKRGLAIQFTMGANL